MPPRPRTRRPAPGTPRPPDPDRASVEAALLLLARAAAPRALARLVELIEASDPRIAIAAAKTVLDHALGEPPPPPDSPDDQPQTAGPDALSTLCKDDREHLRTLLGRALG